MKKAISIAGAVCAQLTLPKRTSTPPVCMRKTDLVRGEQAGGAQTGIGTRGSARSHLSPAMEFSTARSVGDSIPPGGFLTHPSTATTGEAMVLDSATIPSRATSARTLTSGAVVLIMLKASTMRTASTGGAARAAEVFILEI